MQYLELTVRHHASKGRAVYAARPFAAGEVIETNHVVVIAPRDIGRSTGILKYTFQWDGTARALALGHISLCNHDRPANATAVCNVSAATITLVARSAIAIDDEVTLDYGGDHPWRAQGQP